MKELTSYNRVAGYLNKVFDLLNSTHHCTIFQRGAECARSSPKSLL